MGVVPGREHTAAVSSAVDAHGTAGTDGHGVFVSCVDFAAVFAEIRREIHREPDL